MVSLSVHAVEAQGAMELHSAAFKSFVEWLESLNADFVICGSVALKAYGLLKRNPTDLDILMDTTSPENAQVLKALNVLCFEKSEYDEDYKLSELASPTYQYKVPRIGGLCVFHYTQEDLSSVRSSHDSRFIKAEIAVSEKIKWAVKGQRDKDILDAKSLIGV